MIVVERGKIQGEVAARKLGLVVFVVEDAVLAENFRQDRRDPRDEVPLFPGE